MNKNGLSRRDFLRSGGVMLGGGLLGLRSTPHDLWEAVSGPQPQQAFAPDAEIAISAVEKQLQIFKGAPTRVWGYEAQLVSGNGATVSALPGSYLGPLVRVQTGKKLRIVFKNNLGEKSIIHPHGLRVPESCDGNPMEAIGPGQTYIYEFPIIDRAGPYWFHPHPMMRTAAQVLMGLAGLMVVTDPNEEAAVPGAGSGANDVFLVIQDRSFDASNQILIQPGMMMGMMNGYLGDHILVNGMPRASIGPEPRAYRLRLLNGSNARTYKLAWSNGMPLQVIGTDGGLLPAPVSKNYVMLMPGERVDVWSDFSALAGKQVILRSLAFDAGTMGMMGGMMGGGMMGMGTNLPNGSAFDILTVNVRPKASTASPKLGPLPLLETRFDAKNVPNFTNPRQFSLAMMRMNWFINGRTYEEMAVAPDEMVMRDEPIAWEWVNNSPIPHPMHIHNVQFQVVQRTASPYSSYNTVNQGFVDSGWKDTVLVWPGERVKIAMKFGPYTGMYMYHCHILEHEDMGMMRNLMVN